MVAVVGPAWIDQGGWSAAAGSDVVVILDDLAAAGSDVVVILDDLAAAGVLERGGVAPAVLACDALVVVLPAPVGLDPLTAGVWRAAAQAGMPRAVLVTGLDSGTADFEDLAAIAERVLGGECVPVALPVFDDDGSVFGALDLADGVLSGPDGPVAVERAHLRFSAGPRLRLVTALAAVAADEEVAQRALAVVAAADSDDPAADRVVWSGPEGGAGGAPEGQASGQPEGQASGQPDRVVSTDPEGCAGRGEAGAEGRGDVWSLADPLADAVAEGTLAPVLPAAGVAASGVSVYQRLLAWLTRPTQEGRTVLVRRDADGQPCDGPAAVVLAADGQRAVVRPLFGHGVATGGLLTLTRAGAATADPTGPLVAYRAWPVGVVEHEDLGSYAMVTLTMRPAVGDVLTDRPLWLVPADGEEYRPAD